MFMEQFEAALDRERITVTKSDFSNIGGKVCAKMFQKTGNMAATLVGAKLLACMGVMVKTGKVSRFELSECGAIAMYMVERTDKDYRVQDERIYAAIIGEFINAVFGGTGDNFGEPKQFTKDVLKTIEDLPEEWRKTL